jgi:lysyl-tRNA synthetase class 2
MTWRPNSTLEMARARASMRERVHRFFRSRNVLEVGTPALAPTSTTDANIESIRAVAGGREGFLHTSPEHFMKRLLAAGYPDIYQVCRVFRDGEAGRRHLPEFTMVEWYRIGLSLDEIMAESADLVTDLLVNTPLAPTEYREYRAAFETALGIDPLTAEPGEIANALDADEGLRAALGDDRDAWLDLAIADKVASGFPADRLTAIYHYPASQAALARLSAGDERVAERFELYLGPMELANGFVELTDSDEQGERFRRDLDKRAALGRPPVPIDRQLLAALASGLPDCAGVAMGLDRLLMIDQGLDDVQKTVTFTPGATDDT